MVRQPTLPRPCTGTSRLTSQDRVLFMVLVLMDQRQDLGNYLWRRIMQISSQGRPCWRSFPRSLACWTNSVRSSSASDWHTTPKWAGPYTSTDKAPFSHKKTPSSSDRCVARSCKQVISLQRRYTMHLPCRDWTLVSSRTGQEP